MSRIVPRRPSAALVVAIVALFVALGGSAIAATVISSNDQVGTSTITSRNVVDDSLTGADVAEATLGQVPSAKNAASAPLRGYQIVGSASVANPAHAVSEGRVTCPAGKKVLAGGALAFGLDGGQSIVSSEPVTSTGADNAWLVEMRNDSAAPAGFRVFATCAQVG